ncbi:MAG: Rho termination factor N-terminal domain-containing protein, partial [Candidatus Thermoplasmatota archaeon]|nr:Rho termination factor N-terminal domain-containing protein [Candidatus Thermoplasmatota archaeon]
MNIIRRVSARSAIEGAGMFDRFKSWRKREEQGVECPLCQERNHEDAESCSRCSYQLQKASHQQEASVGEKVATDLFDELLEEMEEDDDEETIDWTNAAFTMDDVTIDVKQYGKDDAVVTKQKPSFAFTADLPESNDAEEEEYELKPEDAPEFVTKFEVPETEEAPLEVIEAQQIELIQPTAEAPEEVEITSASEVPETNGSEPQPEPESAPEPEPEPEPEPDPEPMQPGLSDLTVDQLKTVANQRGLSGYSKLKKAEIITLLEAEPEAEDDPEPEVEIPPSPTDLPPPPTPPTPPPPPEVEEDQEPMPIPPPPIIPSIPKIPKPAKTPNYWPWAQQEEWSDRKVAGQVKAAMEAARSRD